MRLIVVVVLALAAAIACYAAWRQLRKPGANERFDVRRKVEGEEDAGVEGYGEGGGETLSSYDRRMIALDAFRSVVGRRPTEDEIDGLVRHNRTEAEIRSAVAAIVKRREDDSDKSSDDDDCSDASSDDGDEEERRRRHGKNNNKKGACRQPAPSDGKNKHDKHTHDEDSKKKCGSAPEPYAPDHVHKNCEASPTGAGWLGSGGGGGDGAVGDARRICLDRADIMRRLEAIGREVDQFRQFVSML